METNQIYMQDCIIYRTENVLTGCISAEIFDGFTEEEAEDHMSDLCGYAIGLRIVDKYSKKECIKRGEFYHVRLQEVLEGIPFPRFYITTKH